MALGVEVPSSLSLVALQGVPQHMGAALGLTLLRFSTALRIATLGSPGCILCFPKASRNAAQAQCHIPHDHGVPGNAL